MSELNLEKLHDDLTDGFITFQYRQDHPFPDNCAGESVMRAKFRSDGIFNAKVMSMVSGVMNIVVKNLEQTND